jgi:hypothetical protein
MRRPTALAAALALVIGVALAHHGWSSYNQEEELALSGVALEVSFENPHSEMMLEVHEAGEPTGEVWEVILPPPARALRTGLTSETLQAGMTVTVTGYAHLSEPLELRALTIQLAEDGEPLALR